MSIVVTAVVIGLLFFLTGCAVFFASVGVRHLALAVGVPYALAPFLVSQAVTLGWGLPEILLPVLLACGALGLLFCRATRWLRRRSARGEHLLLFSISLLGIAESLLSMVFGGDLRSINIEKLSLPFLGPGRAGEFRWAVTGTAATVLTGLAIWAWQSKRIGTLLRALSFSEEGLEIRGVPSRRLAEWVTALGFVTGGCTGVLWAVVLQVRPSSVTEGAILGAIVVLAGRVASRDLMGVMLAAMACAASRFLLTRWLSGDWTVTSALIVLVLVGVVGQVRGKKMLEAG